jgi:GNAT superfamily N-acetyltransferase
MENLNNTKIMSKVKRLRAKKNSFDELFDIYNSNPTAFFQKENNKTEKLGYSIDEIEFVQSNLFFKMLSNYMELAFKDHIFFRFTQFVARSTVNNGDKFLMKISDAFKLELLNGCYLKICPNNLNGLEISELYILPEFQNQDYGTVFMNIILQSVIDSLKVPPLITLECVGAIGHNGNFIDSSIDSQIQFFKNFGFRIVDAVSNYPDYVQMSFNGKHLYDND